MEYKSKMYRLMVDTASVDGEGDEVEHTFRTWIVYSIHRPARASISEGSEAKGRKIKLRIMYFREYKELSFLEMVL